MEACARRRVDPYWTSTEAFSSLCLYIDLDFDGLQQAVVQAIGGASVRIDAYTFGNDVHDIRSRDDALTLLCHLGYLAYDEETGTCKAPNEEVRAELGRAISHSRHTEVARIVRKSEMLLRAIWDMEEDKVCAAIQRAHDNGCAPAFYNDEQALRAVLKSALVASADHYATVEELPSGRGVADMVHLPRRGDPAPALVAELKWNRTPDAAIAQIRDWDCPAILREWGGPVILMDVTYDTKTKKHTCKLEKAPPRFLPILKHGKATAHTGFSFVRPGHRQGDRLYGSSRF